MAQEALRAWRVVYSPPGPGSEPLVWSSGRFAVIRSPPQMQRAVPTPGKYASDKAEAKIPLGGKEVQLTEFEFLTIERRVVEPAVAATEWRLRARRAHRR